MPKLKLPRPRPALEAPPELRWDAPRPSVTLLLSRRQFLKAGALVLAAAALPVRRVERTWARARGRFFTRPERSTLRALCDRILPRDGDPGALALDAPRYIERLLTAFDSPVPRIFAGGPFSNRNPFPDNTDGTRSRKRPRNSFKHFVPLTRLQNIRWRAELFGSAAVPGADFNDAVLGPLVGLRDVYRTGLARVNEVATMVAGAPFARLNNTGQDEVLAMLDAGGVFQPDARRGGTFIDLLIQHTLEGCFGVPEYGGNKKRRGWRLIGLEGDSQPLGYSIFSTADDAYHERPDHPMSTPNPDELDAGGVLTPRPLSADGEQVQKTIVAFTRIFGE
jgi:Gluconate 2-dehydrogenase subunit 3/TAT (twin-arginine translocation) pathway signal sequence